MGQDCINWMRVISNGGVSFFTAFIASIGAGLPGPDQVKVAALVAILQGGLAFMLELKKESEGGVSIGKTVKPSLAVLF